MGVFPIPFAIPIKRIAFRAGLRIRLRPLFEHGILLFWCIFLFAYGLDVGTLYRTEALRAIIGREALQGSWLVPTLYGEPFLTKPPGMYTTIAAASLPFGEVTAVSARLPSVLAATITVFLFFAAFRRVVDRKLALAGAMLMPVSVLWLDKAPSAEIDMLQLAWVSAALLFFLRALEAEDSFTFRARRLPSGAWWLLALLCVTAGFLTKWTAPVFFYLTVIALLAWRRRLSLLWSWRHLVAVGVAIGLCSLWACAVAAQTDWPLLIDIVVAEASQRFRPNHAGRPYPWLESLSYPFQVLAANLPWSLLALYALRPSFIRGWDENGRRLLQLLHCWTWPNLLFWSLPAQHHLRYSLPMCPGMVGLGVMVCISCLAATRSRLRLNGRTNASRLTGVFVGILVVWSIVKIVHVEVLLPQRTVHRHVQATAARLAELVPAGNILYLCQLKDEGVLFYYNRPARRFHWDAIPRGPFVAVLIEAEWRRHSEQCEVVEWLRDQQGDSFVLARFR